jgi:ABC-2 type transport system ATP-binding protein
MLAIQTRRLRKEFGDKAAVADLTLTVRQGEVFGFLGPNGAGKTTSVKMLLGLVRPTAGTAEVLGAPAGNVAARGRVGFLPEHFRFHEWLTGTELLTFHGRLYGLGGPRLAERVSALLARVDLLDAASRRLSTYSKGMLQRIGLAQALLNEPQLVFLDEPTSGLDPLGRLLVRDVINELREGGTTVFLNSHLLSEVEVTCDRVAFVRDGRVVREVALGEREDRLEVELKVAPLTPEVLAGLERFGTRLHQADGLLRLQVAAEEDVPALARWLVERDVAVYRIATVRTSLEEMFLEVMGGQARPG